MTSSITSSTKSDFYGIPNLTGPENYHFWKTKMKMGLMREDMWDITKTISGFPEDSDLVPAYLKKLNQAFATILLKLDEGPLMLVEDLENPYLVWKKLEEIYGESGYSARHSALITMFSTTLSSCKSVTDYVEQITKSSKRLDQIDAQLPDWVRSSFLLHNLGPGHEDFVTMVLGMNRENPEFDLLVQQLYEHDRRKKSSETSSTLFNKSKPNFSTNRPQCSHCKRQGHPEEKCWKKHPHLNPRNKSPPDTDHATTLTLSSSQSHSGWYIDSGATNHITNSRQHFITFKHIQSKVKQGNGETIISQGIGDIELHSTSGKVIIQGVLYAPDIIANLLSIRQLTKNPSSKIQVKFVLNQGEILKSNQVILKALIEQGLFRVQLHDSHNTFFTGTSKSAPLDLWHQRLGHLGFSDVKKLEPLVEGMEIDSKIEKSTLCESCAIGKATRHPNKQSPEKSTRLLYLLHTDLAGPITPNSYGGARYFMTVTDDYSRYSWVFFLQNKNQALGKLKEMIRTAEKECNQKVLKIRSDNGKEFDSKLCREWYLSQGIILETTVPYTPEENGISERLNLSIMNRERSTRHETGLPKELWAENVNTITYLKNRSPT